MKIFTEDTTIYFNAQHVAQTGSAVKKHITVKAAMVMAVLCLAVVFGCPVSAAAKEPCSAEEPDSAEEYLTETGMSMQEVETLDNDFRQYIAGELRNSGRQNWKVNRDVRTLTKTSSEQYTVVFYINVFAFQAGTEHRFYAVYESSTEIMPTGYDSLSLDVGDGFIPRDYGGRVWYKKAGDENWTQGNSLTADRRTDGGGTFSGAQLGDFQRKMLVKGCACCYAVEGEGDDDRVTVEYTYKSPKGNDEIRLYLMMIAVTVIVVMILRRE